MTILPGPAENGPNIRLDFVPAPWGLCPIGTHTSADPAGSPAAALAEIREAIQAFRAWLSAGDFEPALWVRLHPNTPHGARIGCNSIQGAPPDPDEEDGPHGWYSPERFVAEDWAVLAGACSGGSFKDCPSLALSREEQGWLALMELVAESPSAIARRGEHLPANFHARFRRIHPKEYPGGWWVEALWMSPESRPSASLAEYRRECAEREAAMEEYQRRCAVMEGEAGHA